MTFDELFPEVSKSLNPHTHLRNMWKEALRIMGVEAILHTQNESGTELTYLGSSGDIVEAYIRPFSFASQWGELIELARQVAIRKKRRILLLGANASANYAIDQNRRVTLLDFMAVPDNDEELLK